MAQGPIADASGRLMCPRAVSQPGGQPARPPLALTEPHFAVLEVDVDGTIALAAGEAFVALGLDGEKLVGRAAREALEAVPDLERVVEGTLSGHPVDLKLPARGWCLHGEPLQGPKGEPAGAVVTVVTAAATTVCDPTHAARLQLLFEQVPAAVWSTDRDLRFTALVGGAAALSDSSGPAARIGKTLQEYVGTTDPSEPALAHHLAALAGMGSRFRYEHLGRVWAVQVEPLRDSDGAVVGTVAAGVDVTEQVRAEQEIARARCRLEQVQAVAHLGWWEWDVSAGTVTWSDELNRIYGLAPGAFEGTFEAYLSRVHPDDVEKKRRIVLDALRSGGDFTVDHRIVRSDGAVRMVHSRGRTIRDAQGLPARMVGTTWDVTDRWKAQQAAERNASLKRAIVEATADGILVVDCSSKIVAYNDRFLALWKIPRELAERRDDAAVIQSVLDQLDEPERFLESTRATYARPDAETRDVLRFRDGRVFERYSTPQRLGDEIVGRVWSFHDVTQRERLLGRAQFLADAGRLLVSLDVERALESVARLCVPRIAAACAVDLLAGSPRRLVTISVDPALSDRLEVPRNVLAGRSAIWSDAAGCHMSAPMLGRDTVLGAMSFQADRGRIYDDDDLGLVEELARRAALAIDNARLYREARDALQVREEFLSIAAHEIRTPVTSIHLAVQGLRGKDLSGEAARKLLGVVEREDRKLAQLVDDLLDVGRIRSGQLKLELGEVDLVQVVRDVCDRLAPERARSGSALSLEADPQVVGTWDRTRLEQVVANLLSNAVKFGQGRPILLEVRARGERAVLRVLDAGVGIPEHAQARIFEPFERAVKERTYGGLGLGLYIVRTIVEALGGSVRVQSAPGAGAAFTVELPLEVRP